MLNLCDLQRIKGFSFQKIFVISSIPIRSERTGYDFFVARDIIFERLGRRLICECEMLRDDKKHRRMELESMFGVDFGGSGSRDLELV